MKWPDIATFLIAHAVAAGTYLVLFLAVPAALGVVAVILLLIGGIITGDMGGPLFLPAVFIAGLIYALCVVALGVLLCLITGGIQLLHRRIRVYAWVPVVLAFPVLFTVLVLTESGSLILSLGLSAAFTTYWVAFSGSDGGRHHARTAGDGGGERVALPKPLRAQEPLAAVPAHDEVCLLCGERAVRGPVVAAEGDLHVV